MTSNVIPISTDEDFLTSLGDAGDKLVVVCFSLEGSGSCKKMDPIFADMSVKFTEAIFLKVGVLA